MKTTPRDAIVNRGGGVEGLLKSDLQVCKEWITYENTYTAGPGGYDNAVRIVAKGGSVDSDGKTVTVKDADEVLLISAIAWQGEKKPGALAALKDRLAAVPADYAGLLTPHTEVFGKVFDRVALDLGGAKDLRNTTEELLAPARAGQFKRNPAALTQKKYDAGRTKTLIPKPQTSTHP